jgi:hypothetical protein
MTDYPDGARLTLAEFCDWAGQTPAYVRECEAAGIITRDENGLFELSPTIMAMADAAEAELAHLRATHRRTLKGWLCLFWEAPARGLSRLRHWFEYGAGRLLNWLWPVG